MGLWELVSLELDYPAKEIGEYFEKELELKIKRAKCKKEQDHTKKTKVRKIVNRALGKSLERKLVVYGSGFYHHFTYGLCKHADKISEDYAYIHFDHHNDSYKKSLLRHSSYFIGCGSFVPDILQDTNASAVLFIGDTPDKELVHDKLQLHITEKQLRKGRRFEKLKWRLKKLPEEVYLTFDLDVMHKSIITTAYDQGSLRIKELMKCISIIKNNKHIIGADVLGYADIEGKVPGKKLYARIVKSLLKA